MNAAAQHNKSAKRNIKSTLYPFEAIAKTIADKIITKKYDNNNFIFIIRFNFLHGRQNEFRNSLFKFFAI